MYPEPSTEESGIPSVVYNASDDSDYQNAWNGSSFSNMDDVHLGTSGNQPFTNFTYIGNSGVSSVVSNASEDASASDNQNRFYKYQVSGSSFANTGTNNLHLGTSEYQPFTNFTSNENAGVSSVVSNASEDALASNENSGVSSVASNTLEDASASDENSGVSSAVSNTLEDASASNENSGVSSAVSNTLEDASASACQNTWKNLEENQESVISAPNNAFASEDMHFESSGAQINQDFTSMDDGDAAFVERLLKTLDFV